MQNRVSKIATAGCSFGGYHDEQPPAPSALSQVAAIRSEHYYVGSGEDCNARTSPTGDGIYKSNGRRKTWTHMQNLRDAQQITRFSSIRKIQTPFFVAAEGHPTPE